MKYGSGMTKDSDSLVKSEMNNEPSTGSNQKRGRQMSMDASEKALYKNVSSTDSSQQAVETVNIGATSKAARLNNPLKGDATTDHPEGQVSDGHFIPNHVQISKASDKNVPSIGSSDLNINKKNSEDQPANDLEIFLSMHRFKTYPVCPKSGVKRVKVKEVRISENHAPELVENSSCFQDMNQARLENGMPFGFTFIVNPSFSWTENFLFSLGQASRERDASYILGNQYHNWVNNGMPNTGHALGGGNYNSTAMPNWYQKENDNFLSVSPAHNYCQGNFFTSYPVLNSSNEAFCPSLSSSKEANATTSMTPYQGHQEAFATSSTINFFTENSTPRPMSGNDGNGEQSIVPFQGLHDNARENESSGGLISSSSVLPFQSPGVLGDKDSLGHRSLNVFSASTSSIDAGQKSKEGKPSKITWHNNFPATVRSLLTTGILDGVPVKYISWSREMTLRGVIQGARYLCGCQECKLAKVLSAYEFENHAGCKTKHPNNHIYVENGKSIYAVAQELKITPREMLLDAMQNVTGSIINQAKFEVWKASYIAATGELQRADAVMPS